MWIRKVKGLGWKFAYRVTPFGSKFNHKDKTKRRVTIDLMNETADCRDWYTGRPCQANAEYILATGKPKESHMCAHVWSVLSRLGVRTSKQLRKAA